MTEKLRIVHAIPSLGKGGAERLVIDICNELHKRKDIDYRLVIFKEINEYESLSSQLNIVYCNVQVHSFLLQNKKNDLSSWVRFLKHYDPHVVHSHIFFADLISRAYISTTAKYFSHLHGRTTQYELPGFNLLFNSPAVFLQKIIQKYNIKYKYISSDTKFIAVSEFYKNYLERVMGFKGRTQVMHNAINFLRFQKKDKKEQGTTLKLISVGRLVSGKNHKFLLEIAAQLKEEDILFELKIIGEGSLRNDLQAAIKDLKLENNVFLLGNVDNPEKFYLDSHIYLHASNEESFGLTLLEAMAAGLPVICLDGGGNRDIIVQGKNGFLLSYPDTEKFKKIMLEVWKNKALYNKISSFSIEFAKKFDIHNYVDVLLELYRRESKL